MAPWQVLRSGRGTRAAPGSRFHHGPGASVYYSSAEAPRGGRSFCLSAGKLTLQQLNRRLSSYLQQVQFLEAANQKLESQIQKELDRKCPRELRELDGHLRTASLLQDQIRERHSAQAQVQLQLLSAELTVFDLNLRCQKERESRGRLEAELGDLRLQLDELQVRKLPELQSQLHAHTQELQGLQVQHQQGTQRLLSQVSGRVAVEMKSAESADLLQQLHELRHTSASLLHNDRTEARSNEQVSELTRPVVTFDPPSGSEVLQAETKELRMRVTGLEEELMHLQALNVALQVSGLEQSESFTQQLEVLQQRADGRCSDLDSVLQAAAQQASDHQILMDIKTRLEAEILDYKRLLDGGRPQGIAGLQPNSVANVASFCVTTRPPALRRDVPVDRRSAQGGNLRAKDVQAVPRGLVHPAAQTPVSPTSSKTVNTLQSVRVHSRNSPVRSVNTSNLSRSFQKHGGLPETSGRETAAVSDTITTQSHIGQENVHAGDLQTSADCAQVRGASDPPTGITTPTPPSAAAQAEPESFTKQTSTDARLQTNKTATTIKTEVIETCVELKVKQETHTNTSDLCTQTAAEEKNEAEGERSAQVNWTSRRAEDHDQVPAQVVSQSLETPAEAEKDAVSTSVVCEEVQAEPTMTVHEEKTEKISEEKVEDTLILRSDQSPSDSSNCEQKKVTEDTEAGSSVTPAAQVDFREASIQAKDLDSALGLESPNEAVRDAEEDTTSVVLGCDILTSQGKVCGESTLMGVSVTDRQETRAEEATEEIMEDEATGFRIATASSGKPDSNDDLENETEMLEKVEVEGSVLEVLSGLQETVEGKLDLTESDNEMVRAGQEASSSAEEAKRSGSPRGVHVFVSPETCASPVEPEVLMNLTDQMFRPVDPEERVRSPDSLLSPDPEMFLSPNDSDTCLSPVEKKVCLSPDGDEEDEEACLSLSEAKARVRPVEKYILSTKDEDRTHLESFSSSEFPDGGNRNAGVSVGDGDGFGSFEGDKRSRCVVIGADNEPSGSQVEAPAGGSVTEAVAGGPGGPASTTASPVGVSAASSARVHGRFRRDGGGGEWLVYGGGQKRESTVSPPAANQQDGGRFGGRGGAEWIVYGGSHGRKRSLDGSSGSQREGGPAACRSTAAAPQESGRFGGGRSAEWMVYGGVPGRRSSLPRTRREESPPAALLRAASPPDGGRLGGGEWRVYGGSWDRSCNAESRAPLATSPPGTGRFGSGGSGEWRVYGGSGGRMSSWAGSSSLPDADRDVVPAVASLPTSPPGSLRSGRFGSAGSGEWRVYGSRSHVISPPSSQSGSGPRLSRASSAGRLAAGAVVRRSSSVGSGGKLGGSYGYDRASAAGRYSSAGSGEWKPVYSSASARKSSVGSGGRASGGAAVSGQRAPSPGGRVSVGGGGGGWASGGNAGGSAGSGSKLGGAGDRVSGRAGGRSSSSSGSGRTNSTGGRVISSSDRPIRSTGSGAGGSKERISVCKMAALSMSAAGRERSQDRGKAAQRLHLQAAATPPLVQRWLTTGVGVSSADPDGLDDIMRL